MKAIRRITTLMFAVGVMSTFNHSHAQDATPFEEIPGGFDVLTNASISSRPELPSPPGGFDTSSIEALVNFTGLDDDNTKIPPDTYGAVGPSHVVTMLNSQVRISNRAGTTNYSTVTLSNFWGSIVGTIRPFDPRIIYDPYDQRWIATATANSQPQFINDSSLLIGVSQTSDPTGAWHMHNFDVDANNLVWADYPSLGFNRHWVVVQVNMFNIAAPGAFNRSDFYVFNRTNLYAGGTNRTVLSRTGIGGTQVPAVTFNTNQETLYFLQTWNSNFTNGQGQVNGLLRMYTLTGSPGSETLTATTNFPMAEPWASSPGNVAFAPQSNTAVKIFCNDSRIQNVVYRNGSLWCAQTVFLPNSNPTRSSIQWWQIRTDGVVQQSGRVDDLAGINFYAFPSIGVNRLNDVLVGFSSFSSNQYASASYVYRNYYDTLNTMRAVTLFKAGEGRYYKTFGTSRNRWGDYSATMVDPTNDTDLWTIQEYAATPVGTGLNDGDGRWAVQWSSVTVPVPPNDNFASYRAISGQQGTTNGTNLRATKETGEPNHAGNASTASV